MPRSKKQRPKANGAESRMVSLLDDLEKFQAFRKELAPALKADLKSGLTAVQLYEKYQGLAAARGISIMMSERDSGKALSAIKEILDRSQGKATEKKEVTHRFDKTKTEELDAILLSKLDELESQDDQTKH